LASSAVVVVAEVSRITLHKKPNDEMIKKYLEGDSTTGNAQVDKDGKPLGNVTPDEVGKRFKKNYDENLYGIEQAEGSYKRVTQPVDEAGDSGTVASMMLQMGIMSHLGKYATLDEAERALRLLESTGLSRSEAIRSSLLASAARMRRRSQLAAEVAALEADDDDRSEMVAVASLMESVRATG
jgi:hypothetical protein